MQNNNCLEAEYSAGSLKLYRIKRNAAGVEPYIATTPQSRAICNDPRVCGVNYTKLLRHTCTDVLKAFPGLMTEHEAVVVFGDEDDVIHPCVICVFNPTVCVYAGGIVTSDGQFAVGPFRVVEGVYAEVDKHSVFTVYLSLLAGVGRVGRGQRYHNNLLSV